MGFLPPIKYLTKYYYRGDFRRWWYWLPFNRAIRAIEQEFFRWQEHIAPELRHLPEHEQFWATHCFNCRYWLQMHGFCFGEPDAQAMEVLGYLRVELAGTLRYLCGRCAGLYREGQRSVISTA